MGVLVWGRFRYNLAPACDPPIWGIFTAGPNSDPSRNSRKLVDMIARVLVSLMALGICLGCGTSKWTDTRRSATEQLLITDAMDRAVSKLEFRALAGKTVYIDERPLNSLSDAAYLVSCMRQHMLASGCVVKETREDAEYVAEIRAGAIGTDRHELLYGVPTVNIPAVVPVSGFGVPSQIPEIPFVKKTDQRAVAKIAVFAYNRKTGRPVWQSGAVPMESDAKAVWVFGAGPFQRGSIYDGTNFAGDKLSIPLIDLDGEREEAGSVSVADEAYFLEPGEASETALAQKLETPPAEQPPPRAKPQEKAPKAAEPVVQASHTAAAEVAPAKSKGGPPSKPQPKEAKAAKPSPAGVGTPAAMPQEASKPSPTPAGTAAAVAEEPASGSLPATLGPVQDGDGKETGRNDDTEQPTTLSYPVELFAPDYRGSVFR